MSPFMQGAVIGAVAAAVVLLATALLPAKKCPACATALPKFRRPQSGRQALRGGWTCPKCGIQIDRKGRKIG
jgi:hypothetical protein